VLTRLSAGDASGLRAFNPFTEIPVEGVHYRLSPTFGKATGPDCIRRRAHFSSHSVRGSELFRWSLGTAGRIARKDRTGRTPEIDAKSFAELIEKPSGDLSKLDDWWS
jgi:hypothetical protein